MNDFTKEELAAKLYAALLARGFTVVDASTVVAHVEDGLDPGLDQSDEELNALIAAVIAHRSRRRTIKNELSRDGAVTSEDEPRRKNKEPVPIELVATRPRRVKKHSAVIRKQPGQHQAEERPSVSLWKAIFRRLFGS